MRRLDYKRQLIDYFVKNLTSSRKYDKDSLIYALINQGYSRVSVEDAYKEAIKEIAKRAPILKEKPQINYEVYDENNNPVKVEKLSFFERIKILLRFGK